MQKRMTLNDLLLMNTPVIPGTWAAQAMGMDSELSIVLTLQDRGGSQNRQYIP